MAMRLYTELPDVSSKSAWLNHKVEQARLRGRPLLVHVWSIECPSSDMHLQQIRAIQDHEATTDVLQVIGIHRPLGATQMQPQATVLMRIETALANFQLHHPIILDDDLECSRAFDNKCVPAYYLFDAEHRLRFAQLGDNRLQLLLDRVAKVCATAPITSLS